MRDINFSLYIAVFIIISGASISSAQSSVDSVRDLTFQPNSEIRTYPPRRFQRDVPRYQPTREFNPWAEEDEIERRSKAQKIKPTLTPIPAEAAQPNPTQIPKDLNQASSEPPISENINIAEQAALDKKCFQTTSASDYFNSVCSAKLSSLMGKREQSSFESEASNNKAMLQNCSEKAKNKLTSKAMAAGTYVFRNSKFSKLASFSSAAKLECEKQSVLFFAELTSE